uniref:Secreted protein n=1 Tax=Timema poppense TaxID=170557 RepID=A0A7R9D9Z9_TIMPO|nr:unnamed protein product [Timema poppensis]
MVLHVFVCLVVFLCAPNPSVDGLNLAQGAHRYFSQAEDLLYTWPVAVPDVESEGARRQTT